MARVVILSSPGQADGYRLAGCATVVSQPGSEAAAALRHLIGSADVGVLLVSTDLDEVLGLADRVYAIARGRLHEVPGDRRTREGIGALMLGGASDV